MRRLYPAQSSYVKLSALLKVNIVVTDKDTCVFDVQKKTGGSVSPGGGGVLYLDRLDIAFEAAVIRL
jgi:hypothetical protein